MGNALTVIPQLALGVQTPRMGVAIVTSVNLSNFSYSYGGETDGLSLLSIRLGPRFDGEVWGSGRAALFLYGGVDLLLNRQLSDGDGAGWTGFSVDFGVGGRVYAVRQLSVALKFGTMLDMSWYGFDGDSDPERQERSTMWSLYGALAVRFVASR